jgi:CRISPR-associated protein Csm4
MNVVRYRLRPRTPAATPWHADTLFGALCWELTQRGGEAALEETLARFRAGDPPFLLSDGCPGDSLPRPLLLAGRPAYVSREEFVALRRGETPALSDPAPAAHLSVYARVTPEWAGPLRELLASLGLTGFGKRRTHGRGQFDVDREIEPCPWLDPQPFENGFVSLSRFVPEETDPTRGLWTVHVKYPKLEQSDRPGKGRLLQLGPGSCFQLTARPKRFYGRMLTGLPGGAMHYGLSLAVGIKWPA